MVDVDARRDWWETDTFCRWARKVAREHQWRFGNWMDLEDLEMLAYEVFLHVLEKYPDVDTRKHVMSLFQTSLIRRFHSCATSNGDERTACDRDVEPGVDDYRDDVMSRIVDSAADKTVEFVVGMRELSQPVQVLLQYILTMQDGDALKPRRLPQPNRKMRPAREKLNDVFRRVVTEQSGVVVRDDHDLATEMYHFLKGRRIARCVLPRGSHVQKILDQSCQYDQQTREMEV